MTRQEAEQRIAEKLHEVIEIYKEYEPKGEYLHMSLLRGRLSFNNDYWNRIKRIEYREEVRNEGKKLI